MCLKRLFILFSAVVMLISFVASNAFSAEIQLTACDSLDNWSTYGGAVVNSASTHDEGTGAVHVEVPEVPAAGSGGGIDYGFTVDKRGAFWNDYQAIRFMVKGDGSSNWGQVVLISDPDIYCRYYTTFPLENGTWTEVTLPWREFLQQKVKGMIEDHLDEIFCIRFCSATSREPAYPYGDVPAYSLDVDNIRLVNGLTLDDTPIPSGTSIDNVVAKLNAQQPVKIVVMGASIAYGNGCSDPENESWPAQLEPLLRDHYGYDQITVVNKAVGGFSSYQAAALLGRYCYDEEPIDLLILSTFFYNDFMGWGEELPETVDDVVDNHERLFGTVLRRDSFDVMCCINGLHVEAGDLTRCDPVVDALEPLWPLMNIHTADIYHEFQDLGYTFLVDNYYPDGDHVHYHEVGQLHAAQIVRDAIIAAGSPLITLTVPANAEEDAGILTDQGSVTIGEAPGTDLIITLESNDTSEVTVPDTVTILADEVSATFDLTVIDDILEDWNQTVTITATADGYTSGMDTIIILDDDGDSGSPDRNGTKSGCTLSSTQVPFPLHWLLFPLMSCLALLFTRLRI